MRFLLLVTALAHAVHSGNVGVPASSLLSPADVTYVDGSYHAGLAAGPAAYSASLAQPVYQSVAAAPAPTVAVASQQVLQSAPVAYAAPAAKYAAVPTVQHVQGVADVPVTRIDAQPALIQKTVDVARPAVKTQRFEVRRPAIQKQFYDIEERVVVRPAGSALVELDEPLSRTQKGPSVIRPTGEAVAVSSSAAVSPVSPAPAPLPSVEINLARSSLPAPAPAPAVRVNLARTSFAAAAPAVVPSAGVNFARASFAASAPAPVPVQEVSYSAPAPAPVQAASYSAPAPAPVQSVSYSAPAPASSLGFNQFARSSLSVSAPAPIQSVSYSAPAFAAHSVGISAVPIKTVSVGPSIPTGISSVSSGVSGISSVSAGHPGVSFSTPAPQYQQQIVQSTPAPELSDDSVSVDSADFSFARSRQSAAVAPQTVTAHVSSPAPAPEAVFRSQLPPRRFTGQVSAAPAAPRSSLVVNYPDALDLVPQHRFRTASAYSEGSLQSEINHENQQKLIQLLTARGGVTEVGLGRSGPSSYPVEAGEVRARVLSATPAPAYSAPTGERVNTRRVVVSRPIETLQEVEVAEPVTKFERLRVDQPAVVKTASQDVVRVATSVPVYGKALAPVAPVAPVAGYSPDWQ